MNNTHILFRRDRDTEDEYAAATEVWDTNITRFRSEIPEGSLVVARYSCLPFYQDLEDELALGGSRLVNTYRQHEYVAEMEWYQDLEGLTPKTWTEVGWATVPETEHGYVVKGRTNSRKFKWSTHMFASDREGLRAVMSRLYDDPLLADQGLVVREYVPLRKLEDAINGLPVTNEWRCFFWEGQLLASGFYWSQAECAEDMGTLPPAAREVAKAAATRIEQARHKPTFYVVDVGETAEGDWTVIEVNDGQMSGLSMVDPTALYTKLREVTNG